jgi:hypothetical protein
MKVNELGQCQIDKMTGGGWFPSYTVFGFQLGGTAYSIAGGLFVYLSVMQACISVRITITIVDGLFHGRGPFFRLASKSRPDCYLTAIVVNTRVCSVFTLTQTCIGWDCKSSMGIDNLDFANYWSNHISCAI